MHDLKGGEKAIHVVRFAIKYDIDPQLQRNRFLNDPKRVCVANESGQGLAHFSFST